MKKPISKDAAILRLESLCARSEQCTYEIEEKLKKWGVSPIDSAKITSHLADLGFVNDARFANAYTNDKYRFARWGRHKIHTGLIAKRISKDIIADALSSINNREYANIAFDLIAAKLHTLPDSLTQFEKRQRLLRFGIGRGYESALIIKILNSNRLWQ